MSTDGDAGAPRIVGGSPTDEETAAIAAVFAQLLVERAASVQRIPAEPSRTAWERGTRSLRRQQDLERRWGDPAAP